MVPPPPRGRSFEREIVPGLADVTGLGRVRLDAIARWLQDVAYAGHRRRRARRLAARGWCAGSRMRVEAFPRFGSRCRCAPSAAPLDGSRPSGVPARRAARRRGDGRDVDPCRHRDAPPAQARGGVPGGLRRERRVAQGELPPRSPGPARRDGALALAISRQRLDIAGHVNNAAYWEPVEELFAQIGEPESVDLEIEFREPAHPGDAEILRAGPMMWVTGRATRSTRRSPGCRG